MCSFYLLCRNVSLAEYEVGEGCPGSEVQPRSGSSQQLRIVFRSIKVLFDPRATDKDGSGQLDAAELGAFLRAQALHLGATEVQRLFKMLDADGSGEIGLEELVGGVAAARTAHFAALGIPEQPPKPFPPRPPPDTGEDDDDDVDDDDEDDDSDLE